MEARREQTLPNVPFPGNEPPCKPLMEARDMVGMRLTTAWRRLSPTDLTYSDVATALIDIDEEISGQLYQEELREIFHWREIYEDPGPVKI